MAENKADQQRVIDARGHAVSLLDPYALHLLHRHDVIQAEPLREIARQLGPGVSKWHRRIYWIGFAVGLYSVGSAFFLRARSGTGFRFGGIGDVIIALFLVIWVGGFLLYAHSAHRARLKRVRDIMLARLRCPHCGYDIRLLPTDPTDGATVCPECGCAWALPEHSNETLTGDTI